MMALLKITRVSFLCLQKHVIRPAIVLHMQPALSAMRLKAMFVRVCLVTLVTATTATMHQ